MATTFAQKFVTDFVSGGVRIHVQQDNPDAGGGKGTVPTHVKLQLFTWDTDYATTIAGTVLVTEDAVAASEAIEDDEMWLYMFWKPLSAGTYLWLLTVQSDASDEVGTFQVRYYSIDSISGFAAYGDGVLLDGGFESGVMGLDGETYELILSLGDTFATSTYDTDGGHSNPQINRGTLGSPNYVNSIKSQDAVADDSDVKIGRIASGSLVKSE